MHIIEKHLRKVIDKENEEIENWFKDVVDMVQTIAHNRGWKYRILTKFNGVLQQDHYTTGLFLSKQHTFTYTHLYLKNKNDWDHTNIVGMFVNDNLVQKFRVPYITKMQHENADQIAFRILKNNEMKFAECIQLKESDLNENAE